uniref:Retrovirus-related Pol polyprotein from transposon TNT 1-94 n=1 Tax=Tanacetum cinerariifolium TaxID=118510 RepID=A0A6L2N0N0_TANCI|nr:retrovirus-related Pol polyprotein from transposon TNT 1-94 [Tanacetum cinerariifolium]
MDFKSFIVGGIDGEFHFKPEGGFADETQMTYPLEETSLGRRRASKVACDAFDTLDVDSDLDIHEFLSAKELKDFTDCHFVVAYVNPPLWKQQLRDISLEKLYDIQTEIETLQGQVDRLHSRCVAFEKVVSLKGPFILEKMLGYHYSLKVEFDQASDGLSNSSYTFLVEVIVDPYAPVEQLLLKKPLSLRSKHASSCSSPSSSKAPVMSGIAFTFEGLALISFFTMSTDSLGGIELDSSMYCGYHYAHILHGGPSPIVISRGTSPRGQDCSPKKLMRGTFESNLSDLMKEILDFMITGLEELLFLEIGGNVIFPYPRVDSSIDFLFGYLDMSRDHLLPGRQEGGISLELVRAFLVIIRSSIGRDFFCFDPSSIFRIPSNKSSSALSFLLLDVMYCEVCLHELHMLAKIGWELYLQIFVIEDASYHLIVPPYSGGIFKRVGSGLFQVDAQFVSGAFLGVSTVKVEAVIGGSLLALGPGKGVRVEKPGGGVISLTFASMEIEEFLRCMLDVESRLTCDNINGNTMLSEAQGVSLRITSGVRRNRMEKGIAPKPVIVEVFHDLRGDCRVVYHDLCWRGVGIQVVSSHTGNHCEDDFMPIETIRRFLGIIGSKSLSSSMGRPSRGGRRRFGLAFGLLRFGSAFCLFEDLSCVLLRRDSAQLKTSLRFVSIIVQAIAATDDSLAILEHTTLRKCGKLSKGYNKLEWLRFVTIVKQQHKLDEVSYNKLFDILKQYQKEVNELCNERLARNANPLALVATAQANQDPYYQTSKSQKSYAPSLKPSIPTRSHITTRYKGKEIAKPITPPSELESEEDSNPEQAQRDKDILGYSVLTARNLVILKRNAESQKGLKTPHMDEEIDEQELEAHYSYMAKIQEVPTADTCTDSDPLEHVQNDTGYNVFTNELQHSEQSKSINNTCLVETDDSNVIPDSPDRCDDDIQNDQNDVESDDERVVLANLKLNNKQTEFEKYKAFNDRIIDYDKLKRKLNETLGQLAQKDIEIKEGLKLKAYEISVVKEKHGELIKQIILTKSHYEGHVKQKTKVITDLKLKEEHDIDKMLSMEKQLKFFNEIVYKRNQSIQTIHMMAPKVQTYNGRPTFANPRYLKQAQSEIPCLYAFPYDQSTHANRLIPDGEETLALEIESQSKLNKDSYVESLKNEIEKLESDKAEFSNMYDMILQESVSNEVMCTYLLSLSDLDVLAELQCLYLHKVKECDCLAQKLSKQTESVNLKAQLQDKNIAISELKKLIEKYKGKSVETKFDKLSFVRQPNAQRIQKPSVLGKLDPFSDSLERRYFSKTKSVPKTNVSEGLSKPVTTQTLPQTATQAVSNTNVLKPGMHRIVNRTTQTRTLQSPQNFRNTNPYVSTSTGVNHKTNVSRPQHRSNQMKYKVVPNNSQVKLKKTQVEYHLRIPSISNKNKSVTACNDCLNSRSSNANAVCTTCGKCLVDFDHFACVTKMLNDMNARTKKPNVVPISTRKPKGHANKSVATSHKKKVASKSTTQKTKSYYRMLLYNLSYSLLTLWVHEAHDLNLKLSCNFVEKFLDTIHFGNDQFAPILGYGDLVAFQKSTCFVRDLQGNDLLIGNYGSDLYIISLQELTSSTPLCLMAKASPTQAWLWHQRLSHLNFDYINLLLKKDVVIGLPKLQYIKDQLCSSCKVIKAKRSSFKSKDIPSLKGRLNLLHMDLCGPMRVASINGKLWMRTQL